ncbi:hypothetical protein J1N35_035287 [Gossypium stocksii]|uniref:Uncharacterized protein n=1 Tax=Gossypium stocksii TaxID=47602 RepID=A0A9D3UTN5_9ROSI|nr:hypothetical protein J1N35_035287 [Gossypium stocksii]
MLIRLEAVKYPRIEDEYEVALQLQLTMPKTIVICSPKRKTSSKGGSFHQQYGSGKGKAPMEQKCAPPVDDP